MADPKNVHIKHRSRMKGKLLENGGENYHPHQLLEMLLFYTIPRKDTNPAAHKLLNRFNGIDGVLSADIADLEKVDDVGPVSACLIRATGEICRRYSLGLALLPPPEALAPGAALGPVLGGLALQKCLLILVHILCRKLRQLRLDLADTGDEDIDISHPCALRRGHRQVL